jgi:acyl-CoA thioesterase YciA
LTVNWIPKDLRMSLLNPAGSLICSEEDSMPDTEEFPKGEVAIRTIAMPADANSSGDIFGGWLMSQMDLAASNVAGRRAHGRCVTVAVDKIIFHRPVYIGDEVSLYARVVKVGRTSITIEVEAWRRSQDGDDQIKVTQASFVFVAVDRGRRPRVVPRDSGES